MDGLLYITFQVMIYLYLGKKIDFYYYYNLFIIHTIWELWQILIGMTKIWE